CNAVWSWHVGLGGWESEAKFSAYVETIDAEIINPTPIVLLSESRSSPAWGGWESEAKFSAYVETIDAEIINPTPIARLSESRSSPAWGLGVRSEIFGLCRNH